MGSGKDYRHLKTGDIPVFGTGGYMLSVNKSLYSGETVCIGRKGTINKPFYYNGDIWTVDTLFYTYDYKDITPKFTYIIFQQIPWLKYNEASGVPSLSKSTIEKIKINLPAILEQQKIADFLGVVDGWIKNLKEQKENFESYRRAIMQKIFSQEIRFKDNGKSFPAWEEKRLEDVAKFRRGSFPQPYGLRKWYDDKNGFPFVQVFDVDDNFKLKKYTKRKITQEAKDLSVLTKKGTIVLTIQGSIGRIALTQYDACIDRTLLIFESFKMPIDKIFFFFF
ncbi:MAG: restriction endonuclease subunit S [Candidatus Staskawiczbacteria bacterium]|nr:restriction endonuclease subunit S [Candidatus Staskawiczbacteria bacterium]